MNRMAKWLLLGACVLALPAMARAQCPANSIFNGPFEDFRTEPVYSWSGSARYDQILGTFYLEGGGGGGELGSFLDMSLADVYRIVGPASDTPIPIRIRLFGTGETRGGMQTRPVIGTFCSTSNARLRISEGTTFQEFTQTSSFNPCESLPLNAQLELQVAHVPGEDFTILYSIHAYGAPGSLAYVNGGFMFLVPAGYSIESCKGYAGPTVPADARSWGSLKSLYR
jgi:hypothetical protein